MVVSVVNRLVAVTTQPRHSEWSAAESRNLPLAGARFLDSTALRFVPLEMTGGLARWQGRHYLENRSFSSFEEPYGHEVY
jgi:hypothetical protein